MTTNAITQEGSLKPFEAKISFTQNVKGFVQFEGYIHFDGLSRENIAEKARLLEFMLSQTEKTFSNSGHKLAKENIEMVKK